jgi:hypothetical protein
MCVGGFVVQLDGPPGRINGFIHCVSRGLLVFVHPIDVEEIFLCGDFA